MPWGGLMSSKGFSLIELMVTIAIVMTVMVAITAFTITVMRSDSTAVKRSTGVLAGVLAIEDWFSGGGAPPAQMTVGATTYDVSSSVFDPYGSASLPSGERPAGRQVTLQWQEHGQTHQVTLSYVEPAP